MDDDRWARRLLEPGVSLRVAGAGPIGPLMGWGIGPRTMDEHILHALTAGGSAGEVGGRAVRCIAGDLLWIPAGVPHRLVQTGSRPLRFWRLRLSVDGLPRPARVRLWRPLAHAAAVLADACAPPLAQERLKAALVLLLDRPGGEPEAACLPWWPAVEAYLARSGAGASLVGLIRASGLGPRAFSRACRARSGLPPRLLLIDHRCRLAAEALAAGASVAEAASGAGWSDPYLFSKVFRRRLGMPPSRWRRMQQES